MARRGGRASVRRAVQEEQIAQYKEDTAWMRRIICPFCGMKVVVNNYEDHKVRLPKHDGVVMCPWCSQSEWRAQYLADSYKLVVKRARAGSRSALALLRAMPVTPKEFRVES